MPSVVETTINVEQVLQHLHADFPALTFTEGTTFSWQAGRQHVSYKMHKKNTIHDIYSLLHEVGHALLQHKDFTHDIELLQLEVAAWDKAHELAERYGIELDDDYVQDCLDTYRDWLHLRATCPNCFARSLQSSPQLYRCFDCGSEWHVTKSRLCRPYRLTKRTST